METLKAANKGYGAEITVVTYGKEKEEKDKRSKFRILLVSFLRSFVLMVKLSCDKWFNIVNNCMQDVRFFFNCRKPKKGGGELR